MNHTYYTQDILLKKRSEIDQQLQKSKKRMASQWQALTSPTKADTQVQQWMGQAEKAFAIYDGFMMMYKLIHRFNTITSIFKRKKKR